MIKRFFDSLPGHPSLCYRHEGDGKCEDFEKKTNIKDCGFYTPEGFEDQWAVNVTVNSDYRDKRCPESVILGPPPLDLVGFLMIVIDEVITANRFVAMSVIEQSECEAKM